MAARVRMWHFDDRARGPIIVTHHALSRSPRYTDRASHEACLGNSAVVTGPYRLGTQIMDTAISQAGQQDSGRRRPNRASGRSDFK